MNIIDKIFAIIGIIFLLLVCLVAWWMASGKASITLKDEKDKPIKKWGHIEGDDKP
jgi:ABC-type Co2+ transport system permease subunit